MEIKVLEAGMDILDNNIIKEIAGVVKGNILDIWTVMSCYDNDIPDILHYLGSIEIPENHPFLFLEKGKGSVQKALKTHRENKSIIEIGIEIEISLPAQKVRGKIERIFCLERPKRFIFIIGEWWIEIREKVNDESVIEIFPKNPSITYMELGIDKIQ